MRIEDYSVKTIRYFRQNGQISTLFMAIKTDPFGAAQTFIAYTREYPPLPPRVWYMHSWGSPLPTDWWSHLPN